LSSLLEKHTPDTPVTKVFDDRGIELSGGQKQKLAVARAFYRSSSFIILDEPSAELDPEAEYRLFEKFEELRKNKSALLISHRLANTARCDEILVLDGGRIIEQGTHTQLMCLDGYYAHLFNLQAKRYLTEPE
jgi:ATP-binding cassette subfamily B protein